MGKQLPETSWKPSKSGKTDALLPCNALTVKRQRSCEELALLIRDFNFVLNLPLVSAAKFFPSVRASLFFAQW